jgi:hypothetical protein
VQIQRFDLRNQTASGPSGLRRGTNASGSSGSNGVSRDVDAGGGAASGELEQLSRRLGEVSEVRAEVVAEAKVRMQRGDYLTRAAAEKTAAAILSKDA